uniref:Copia protein n=1 Tax=Cajanus cajan TaxID=3821 RepID=A0A151TNW7_CAJCA|nr:Copia protein [Cajanus cajan]KYP68721.1 Copia protein [Cajanus cajan]
MIQREEDHRVHLFLGGLENEEYSHIKATILNTEPLPSLRRAFNHIQREESHLTTDKEKSAKAENGAAFHSSKGVKPKGRGGSRSKCDHCGKTGHIKPNCFEIIGYPENWNTRRTQNDTRRQGHKSNAFLAFEDEEKEAPKGAKAAHTLHEKHMTHNTRVHENMAGNNKNLREIEWVLDSGASHHMTPCLSLLKAVRKIEKPFYVTVPTGNVVLVESMGYIDLDKNIKLENVLFVPQFSCNLISVHKLARDSKCILTYDENRCVLQDQTMKEMIGLGDMHEGVYILRRPTKSIYFTAFLKNMAGTWHSRLGHPLFEALQKISNIVKCSFITNKEECCDICHKSKQCRFPFNRSNNKAEAPFHLIHYDLWGKYNTASHNGSHYFLTIVDDYSRATWVYLMRHKSETLDMLKKFCTIIKRQFNVDVKKIRSDNGTEFTNSSFQRYIREEGIVHETSCVGTPQQNARVERKHRHILNVARALRFEANLPIHFWGECVLTATHLINRTPTIANSGITPYEMLYGKPPSYDHLRIFGCLCYVKNSSKQQDKFTPRSKKYMFIGYPQNQKGWKVYNLETHEFFISRDVIFYE